MRTEPQTPPVPPPLRLTPQEPTAQPAPLPRDQFNRILTLYFEPEATLEDMGIALNLTLREALDLLDHPEVALMIERICAAAEKRAAILARRGCELAARTFTRLADNRDRPETARKSAGALLRLRATDPGAPGSLPPPAPNSDSPREAWHASALRSMDPPAADSRPPWDGNRCIAPEAPNSSNQCERCASPGTPVAAATGGTAQVEPERPPPAVEMFRFLEPDT